MEEQWKEIEGFPTYQVSNLGRIKSFRRYPQGKILVGRSYVVGYPTVVLFMGGGVRRCFTLHTLVAAAFIGPRPEGMDVCHKDGTRDNSAASNLSYGTRAHNIKEAVNHGRRKLSPEQVREIRVSTASWVAIAKQYNISASYAGYIKNRKFLTYVE